MSCLRSRFAFYLSLVCVCVALLASLPVSAQVVSTDFDDGTTDGWFGFGGPTVAVSTTQAFSAPNSLLTTNRTANFNGPGIDLTKMLTGGQTYVFKVQARLSDN